MPKIATSGNDSFRKHMPCKQNIRILARDVLSGHSRATAPTGDYERVGLVPDGMEGDESVRIINSSISENKNNNNNNNNHNNNTSNTTTQTNANNNNNHSNSHHANSNNSSCVFGDNNANAAPRASMTMEMEQHENVNNVAPADAVNAVNVVPGAEGGPMGPMVPGAGVLPQYFGMNGMGPGGLAQVEGVQDVSMPGAAAIDAPPPHLAIAGPSATRARGARGARGRAGGVPPRANSKKGNELLGRTGMKKEVNRSIFSHMKVKERSVKTIEMNEQRRRRDYVLKPLKRLKGAIPMPAPMARKDDDAYDAQEQKEDDDWDMGAGNNNNNNNNNGSNGKYESNDYGTNKRNNNYNNNANPFETMQTVAPIAQTGDEREDEDLIMNKNSGSSGCFAQFDTNLMEQENNCNSSNGSDAMGSDAMGSDAMASSGSNGSNGSNGKKGTKGIDCNDTFGPMSRGKSGPGSSSGTGATSAAHGTHGTNGTDGTKEKDILKGAKKLFEQDKLAEARNALKVLEESNNLGTALRNKIASLKRAIDAKEATIKAKEELAAWDDDI